MPDVLVPGRDRVSFAKLEEVLPPPDLVGVQRESFDWLLKDGLKEANRLQQLTMQFAKPGATGNQALLGALGAAKHEGLTPSIYCHPIGYHGHVVIAQGPE